MPRRVRGRPLQGESRRQDPGESRPLVQVKPFETHYLSFYCYKHDDFPVMPICIFLYRKFKSAIEKTSASILLKTWKPTRSILLRCELLVLTVLFYVTDKRKYIEYIEANIEAKRSLVHLCSQKKSEASSLR